MNNFENNDNHIIYNDLSRFFVGIFLYIFTINLILPSFEFFLLSNILIFEIIGILFLAIIFNILFILVVNRLNIYLNSDFEMLSYMIRHDLSLIIGILSIRLLK